MMSLQNDDLDLGLGLNYSSQCIEKTLSNVSGAGVNAGSRVNVAFATANPLSELVWSPQKGLCLKSADCTLMEKENSLLCGMGSSNIVLSSPQNIKSSGSEDGKLAGARKLLISQRVLHTNCDGSNQIGYADLPAGNTNPVCGFHKETTGPENQRQALFLSLGCDDSRPVFPIRDSHGKFDKETTTNFRNGTDCGSSGIHKLGIETASTSGFRTLKQPEALDGSVSSLPSAEVRQESALRMEIDIDIVKKANGSQNKRSLKIPEFTAESNSRNVNPVDACCESEGTPQRNQPGLLKSSKTESTMFLCQNKRKVKALSDGNLEKRMSKDEEGSQGSVESCNSAGLFLKGNKRGRFEPNWIFRTERSKNQIQEVCTSIPTVGTDSSFINWISNMVKGFGKYSEDEAPSVVLHDGDKSHGNDCGGINMGFQTLFQSLYLENSNKQTKSSDDSCLREERRKPVLVDKTCVENIAPTAYCGENDKSRRQLFLSSDQCTQSPYGNSDGSRSQPPTLREKVSGVQAPCSTNATENKVLSNLECTKERASSSASSHGICNTRSAGKYSANPTSDSGMFHNADLRSDTLRNVWITRFSQKTPESVLNKNHCSQSTPKAVDSSASRRLVPFTRNCTDSPIDQKEYDSKNPINVSSEDLRNSISSTDVSLGFDRIVGHSYEASLCKLNPNLNSTKRKNLEALTTLFVTRLDSLKNIIRSGVKADSVCTSAITCLFCGGSDHSVCDCAKLMEMEVEELVKKNSVYGGTEVSPCFCIRCFSFDHWAVSCPMSPSSRQLKSTRDICLADCQISPCKWQLRTGRKTMSGAKEADMCSALYICTGEKLQGNTNNCLHPKYCGKMISDERAFASVNVGENILGEDRVMGCNFVHCQIAAVPKGKFDAMRSLRLSRANVLKLVNSQTSISYLEGFFLRLRLKKHEGLDGAGYHVACITGTQEVESPIHSTNAISVIVGGGVKCVVELRYISNHDFQEDELMSWWCNTLRSGGKIPSEDELKLKLIAREELGI